GNDLEPTRLGTYSAPHRDSGDRKDKEVAVRSGSTWKKAINTFKGKREDDDEAYTWDDPNDPGHTIVALREDMLALWRDPFVQDVLHKRRLQLEHPRQQQPTQPKEPTRWIPRHPLPLLKHKLSPNGRSTGTGVEANDSVDWYLKPMQDEFENEEQMNEERGLLETVLKKLVKVRWTLVRSGVGVSAWRIIIIHGDTHSGLLESDTIQTNSDVDAGKKVVYHVHSEVDGTSSSVLD
ncbi:hypothetical protein RSAG8_13569, partial [Rhizoctonia solani AG-8 WAC10335]